MGDLCALGCLNVERKPPRPASDGPSLIALGKAARYMCSPAANLGQPPREPFVIQLREARAGWLGWSHNNASRIGRLEVVGNEFLQYGGVRTFVSEIYVNFGNQ